MLPSLRRRRGCATPCAATQAPGRTRRTGRWSQREIDVLARLEQQSDKEIARVLKLSFDGVRYPKFTNRKSKPF